jgi:hypothetical protein
LRPAWTGRPLRAASVNTAPTGCQETNRESPGRAAAAVRDHRRGRPTTGAEGGAAGKREYSSKARSPRKREIERGRERGRERDGGRERERMRERERERVERLQESEVCN